MDEDAGSLSVESVFDTLLRMGLVMQMTVLTVTIMLTILFVFLLNVGIGAIITKVGFTGVTGLAAATGITAANDALEPQIVNATQNAILGWLKWNP